MRSYNQVTGTRLGLRFGGLQSFNALIVGGSDYNNFYDHDGKLWRQYGEKEYPAFKTLPQGGANVRGGAVSEELREVAANGIILDKSSGHRGHIPTSNN